MSKQMEKINTHKVQMDFLQLEKRVLFNGTIHTIIDKRKPTGTYKMIYKLERNFFSPVSIFSA